MYPGYWSLLLFHWCVMPREIILKEGNTVSNAQGNTSTCGPSYRMHQKNKKETKAWYRCTRYESSQCQATAVVQISSETFLKVTRSHVHSPGFLQDFARFENAFFIILSWQTSNCSSSVCTFSRLNICFWYKVYFLIFLHEQKEFVKNLANQLG